MSYPSQLKAMATRLSGYSSTIRKLTPHGKADGIAAGDSIKAMDAGSWAKQGGGFYSFEHGHMLLWTKWANPEDRPAYPIRDQLIEQLFADGIGVSVHYIPLHLHPYWKERYDLQPAQFPHSQKAYERMVSLPLYTRMTDADVERVITAVRKAFGR